MANTMICSSSVCATLQDVLMKDLPDPNQQRRYSRRPTVTSLPAESGLPGTTTNQNGATVTRTESLLKEEAPSITVKGLSAAWSGKVGDHTRWLDCCVWSMSS